MLKSNIQDDSSVLGDGVFGRWLGLWDEKLMRFVPLLKEAPESSIAPLTLWGKCILRPELDTKFLRWFGWNENAYSLVSSVQSLSCVRLCDLMNRSTPGLPVHHQLPEFTQIHVHWVGDAIQLSHPLSSPSPPALNPSRHQGLFQWVNSSHEVAKVLEFQFQHQSFQWTPRTDLL